jgi:hypothetical protein
VGPESTGSETEYKRGSYWCFLLYDIYIINLFSDIPIIYQHLSLLWFMFHPFF